MENIQSAWKHDNFAGWLVRTIDPKVIVDLGVDYGYSTFVFGSFTNGKVYGIDWFKGDVQTGFRNTYDFVMQKRKELGLEDRVEIINSSFEEALKNWNKGIDILHIDGHHGYASVEECFRWTKFLNEGGVVLFSTASLKNEGFEVWKFYNSLENEWYKGYLPQNNGFAVATKNAELFKKILIEHKEFLPLSIL